MRLQQNVNQLDIGKRSASCSPFYSLPPTSSSPHLTSRLLITAIVSTLSGGFHFGYLISAVNPLSQILQQFLIENIKLRYNIELTDSELALTWSFLAGSLFVGAFVGSFIAVYLLEKIGSRKTLLLAALILLFATPIFGLAYVFDLVELLPISRILSGIGFGIGISAQGVYLTEISPIEYRGVTNSLSGLMGNIAFFIASVFGTPFVFGTEKLWANIFFVEMIPCLVHIFLNIVYFRETPKFLIEKGKSDEAEETLKLYYGEKFETKKIMNEITNSKSFIEKELSFRRMLKDRNSLRALSLSFAINFSVAFSGIIAFSFFGTFLLQTVGFSEVESTIANCVCSSSSIISAILATIAIDKVGRRSLVISSLVTLVIINVLMLMLSTSFESTKNQLLAWPFLVLFISFLFVFSIGIGPTALFLGAELSPPGMITKMQSYSVSVQYIGSFICPMLYLPLNSLIGPYSFMLFIIPLTVIAAYFYIYLPETKGKSPAEINELFNK